ncbi:MAG: hypothetical protein QM698_09580 [Micropepsaceae bacterium]
MAERDWLLGRVSSGEPVTLTAELAGRGVAASAVSIWRVLREAGYSFKKNSVRQRSRRTLTVRKAQKQIILAEKANASSRAECGDHV